MYYDLDFVIYTMDFGHKYYEHKLEEDEGERRQRTRENIIFDF
jgi:hypothetical protein